jgi:dCTP deaminase
MSQGGKILSYGLSSFGYDVRLSPKDFRIFKYNPEHQLIDPKNFSESHLESAKLHVDESGEYFIIPGHSYALGVTLETLVMPSNVSAICVGKSTYARCGIILNTTPIEAGWAGYITLEFSNASHTACKVYANEGIAQLQFLRGNIPITDYSQRRGKYDDQKHQVTLPIV